MLTFAVGLGLMCPAAVFLRLGLSSANATTSPSLVLYIWLSVFVMGLVLFMVGVLRIWGKIAYHFILPRWPIWIFRTPHSLRQTLASNSLARWVYWIDERGEDRDRDA